MQETPMRFIPLSYIFAAETADIKIKNGGKHMKKLIAMLLAVMMVMSLFAACNNTQGGTTTEP